jgi:O-antigen/teichoic acid export membrane protein
VLRDIIVYYIIRTTLALIALTVLIGSLASALLHISWWIVPSVAALIAVDTARSLEITLMTAARWQKPPALWNATEALARPLIAVAFIHIIGGSPQIVLFAFFVASLATYAFFQHVFVQKVPYGKDDSKTPEIAIRDALSREIRWYAIPIIPAATVAWINSLSDRYVIAVLLGLAQSGIYMAAYGLVSRPFLMVGGLILQTLQPVYYEAVSRGEEQRAMRISRLMLQSMAATCIAGCVLVFLLKDPIGHLLLGPNFRSSIHLLPWFAVGYTFLCLSYVRTTASLAYKRSGAVFAAELAGACCSLGVGIPLIWIFGLEGAAVAVPVYYFVQLVTAHALAKRDFARYWRRTNANA